MIPHLIALLLGALLLQGEVEESPKKLMASSVVRDRLWGIFVLTRDKAEPKAEDLLLTALNDPDWEVIEQAAEALGSLGTGKSVPALVDIVAKGAVERVRLAAARSIAKLDPAEGVKLLSTRLKGEDVGERIDALAVIGGPEAVAVLEKVAGSKDPARQRAARLALGSVGEAAQFDRFAQSLNDPDLELRISAMHGLARVGTTASLELLLGRLKVSTSDVEERRVRRSIVELLLHQGGAERDALYAALETRVNQGAGARHARLWTDVGLEPGLVSFREKAAGRLVALAGAAEPSIRAAAVHGLGSIGTAAQGTLLEERVTTDGDAHVRLHAMRALVALRGVASASTLAAVLAKDASPIVKEEAAALCGLSRLTGTESQLEALVADPSWQVAVAATISLGKLRHTASRARLIEALGHKEWRRRGAAALALAWFRDKEAVDAIVERAFDDDPSVRATIIYALRRVTGELKIDKPAAWQAWWKKNRETVKFIDDRKPDAKPKDEKYGSANAYAFFNDLDVATILSPRDGGDHIEDLLKRYTIKHRPIEVRKLTEAGLQPFAICVVNCSGELAPEDIERVEWFVRCGGYLFASCWGLTETVNKAFPGIVQMHPTPGQVLDEVRAVGLSDTGLMRSVLRPATHTRYVLEGSHLISVVDKERFEVLIDSPQCATRWGEGNLAGFFTIGHGLVFDSANHFDLQGMKRDMPKQAKDRRAMAMDVLGYDHSELRDFDTRGIFKNEKKCSELLEDLSMFRLVTNFVEKKRLAEF